MIGFKCMCRRSSATILGIYNSDIPGWRENIDYVQLSVDDCNVCRDGKV
jgi:hypothetical protein